METSGPEHDESFDFLFKIILIGDSNVGKTCLVQNFKSGIFSERQQNTIGVDFTVRTVDIEGKKVKMQGTFDSVTHWIKEVEIYGANNVVLVLIGNKCDLEKERQVQFEDACNLSKEKDILAALETSAKESQNVDEAFIMMARELLSRNGLDVQQEDSERNNTPRVLLRSNSRPINGFHAHTPPEKKTCC
ncbi:hypothetical protein KUCAC02_006885 [Chaenocephalus aceratus]|uniref:Uncharacterized protein n=1 Tax=Chaenocephalus aceratus TaxID=36190 RepID=A0ACB9VU51_CHAAC|nr:hypothetical protein KUCAC02_006885 [Chaenocephalus aceratus]